MKSITVTPAYGRDYKSAHEALGDWEAGKDFFLEAIDGRPYGTYCSRRDFRQGDEINIRYDRKRQKTVFIM